MLTSENKVVDEIVPPIKLSITRSVVIESNGETTGSKKEFYVMISLHYVVLATFQMILATFTHDRSIRHCGLLYYRQLSRKQNVRSLITIKYCIVADYGFVPIYVLYESCERVFVIERDRLVLHRAGFVDF